MATQKESVEALVTLIICVKRLIENGKIMEVGRKERIKLGVLCNADDFNELASAYKDTQQQVDQFWQTLNTEVMRGFNHDQQPIQSINCKTEKSSANYSRDNF